MPPAPRRPCQLVRLPHTQHLRQSLFDFFLCLSNTFLGLFSHIMFSSISSSHIFFVICLCLYYIYVCLHLYHIALNPILFTTTINAFVHFQLSLLGPVSSATLSPNALKKPTLSPAPSLGASASGPAFVLRICF